MIWRNIWGVSLIDTILIECQKWDRRTTSISKKGKMSEAPCAHDFGGHGLREDLGILDLFCLKWLQNNMPKVSHWQSRTGGLIPEEFDNPWPKELPSLWEQKMSRFLFLSHLTQRESASFPKSPRGGKRENLDDEVGTKPEQSREQCLPGKTSYFIQEIGGGKARKWFRHEEIWHFHFSSFQLTLWRSAASDEVALVVAHHRQRCSFSL